MNFNIRISQVLYPYNVTDNRPEPKVYRGRDGTLLVFNSTKTEVSAKDLWETTSSLSKPLESIGTTSIRSIDISLNTSAWKLTVGKDCCYSPQQPTTDATKGKSNPEYFSHIFNIYGNN